MGSCLHSNPFHFNFGGVWWDENFHHFIALNKYNYTIPISAGFNSANPENMHIPQTVLLISGWLDVLFQGHVIPTSVSIFNTCSLKTLTACVYTDNYSAI